MRLKKYTCAVKQFSKGVTSVLVTELLRLLSCCWECASPLGGWEERKSHLLCISHSFAPILISHTHTNPSPPPLTIFQSSACTEVTPRWWAYRDATEEPARRSNTLTLNHSRDEQMWNVLFIFSVSLQLGDDASCVYRPEVVGHFWKNYSNVTRGKYICFLGISPTLESWVQ